MNNEKLREVREHLNELRKKNLWEVFYCECKKFLLGNDSDAAELACASLPMAIIKVFGKDNFACMLQFDILAVPDSIKHKKYLEGLLLCYKGDVQEGLNCLTLVRSDIRQFVLNWKFTDHSIRGGWSIIDFDEIKKAIKENDIENDEVEELRFLKDKKKYSMFIYGFGLFQ